MVPRYSLTYNEAVTMDIHHDNHEFRYAATTIESRHRHLTRRQAEIAVLLPQGATALEMSAKLSLSVSTVRGHLAHIKAITSCQNLPVLAVWAHAHRPCCLRSAWDDVLHQRQ